MVDQESKDKDKPEPNEEGGEQSPEDTGAPDKDVLKNLFSAPKDPEPEAKEEKTEEEQPEELKPESKATSENESLEQEKEQDSNEEPKKEDSGAEENQEDGSEPEEESNEESGQLEESEKESDLKSKQEDKSSTEEENSVQVEDSEEEPELESEEESLSGAEEESDQPESANEVAQKEEPEGEKESEAVKEESNDEKSEESSEGSSEEYCLDDSGADENLEEETGSSSPKRKVAKTLIDQEVNLPKQKRVAKTLLETSKPDLSAMEALIDDAQNEDEESEEQPKERKVSKTLVETEIPQALQDKVLEAAEEIENSNKKISQELVNKKISRTMIEVPDAVADTEPPKRESYVARTMLDHELILDTLSDSLQRIEEKTKKEIEEKEKELANEPVKEVIPIEGYKTAKHCKWIWEEDGYYDQFRYCGMCKQLVYNFEGLDKPEAEALIFKRENRENAPLYKRDDGYFMTADCPLALKQSRNIALLVMAGGSIFVLLLLVMLLNANAPPAPTTGTQEVQEPTKFQENGSRQQGTSSTSGAKTATPNYQSADDGSFHYDASDPTKNTMPAPSTNRPERKPDYSGVPEADQSGGYWEFPNGKPTSLEPIPQGNNAARARTQPKPKPQMSKPAPTQTKPVRKQQHPTVRTY